MRIIITLILTLILLIIFSGCTAINPDRDGNIQIDNTRTDKNSDEEQEANGMGNILINSEGFESGGTLPAEYTCSGEDISPPLTWEGIPAGTASIAVIMDDPDARGFVHWVIFNIPASSSGLPAGITKSGSLEDGFLLGQNNFGETGYGGPCPPPGKPHRYYFRVYALDTVLELEAGATRAQLEAAMKGHILAQGEVMGLYGR